MSCSLFKVESQGSESALKILKKECDFCDISKIKTEKVEDDIKKGLFIFISIFFVISNFLNAII